MRNDIELLQIAKVDAPRDTYFEDAETDRIFDFIYIQLCKFNSVSPSSAYLERTLSIYVSGHRGRVEEEPLSNAFHDDAIMIHDIFVALVKAGITPPTKEIGISPKRW